MQRTLGVVRETSKEFPEQVDVKVADPRTRKIDFISQAWATGKVTVGEDELTWAISDRVLAAVHPSSSPIR